MIKEFSSKIIKIKLEPMRVAYTHVISKTPETDAWDALVAWAKPRGFFDNPGKNTIFGYNNPPNGAKSSSIDFPNSMYTSQRISNGRNCTKFRWGNNLISTVESTQELLDKPEYNNFI